VISKSISFFTIVFVLFTVGCERKDTGAPTIEKAKVKSRYDAFVSNQNYDAAMMEMKDALAIDSTDSDFHIWIGYARQAKSRKLLLELTQNDLVIHQMKRLQEKRKALLKEALLHFQYLRNTNPDYRTEELPLEVWIQWISEDLTDFQNPSYLESIVASRPTLERLIKYLELISKNLQREIVKKQTQLEKLWEPIPSGKEE